MKNWPAIISALALTSVLITGVAWYLRGSQSSAVGELDSLASPGIALANEKGCVACHSLDGTAGIGPTWKGTYGSIRVMKDGTQHTADDAYLRKSMLEPAAEVVTGFENVMIPPELSETEIAQLLQLFRQLGTSSSG